MPEGIIIDRAALGYIKARKTRSTTLLAKTAGKSVVNQAVAVARLVAADHAANKARLANANEQAKAFLQRRGYVVFSGKLCTPPRKGIIVGRQIFPNDRAVMTYAASLGFVRPRQGAKAKPVA